MRCNSLFSKILASYVLMAALALGSLSLFLYARLDNFGLAVVRNELGVSAAFLEGQALSLLESGQTDGLERLCVELAGRTGIRVTVVAPDGKVLAESAKVSSSMDSHSDRPELLDALAGRPGSAVRVSGTLDKRLVYVALPLKGEDGKVVGALRLAMPFDVAAHVFLGVFMEVAVVGLLILALACVLAVVLAGKISSPIEVVKDCAASFANGGRGRRVPVFDIEEMSSLSNSINLMADGLQSSIRELAEKGERQDAIFANMDEGIIALDAGERLILSNKAAEGFLLAHGGASSRKTGRLIHELTRDNEILEFIDSLFKNGGSAERELVHYGEEKRFIYARGRILGEPPAVSGAVVVLSDITRLRHLEDLRREFVANVSHELKTPLTSIKAAAETLMGKGLGDKSDGDRFLAIILKNSERLEHLIEDILNLSKIERQSEAGGISVAETRLGDFLAQTLRTFSEGRPPEIAVVLECPADLVARINPEFMAQAILNLLENAVRYNDGIPEIKLSAGRDSVSGAVSISVADNGFGIPEKDIGRIFERFYVVDKARSRKVGGTGLGLSIVKHIALAHKGLVSVKSEPGKGSVFTIELPGAGGHIALSHHGGREE